MWTYQVRRRTFRVDKEVVLDFNNSVEIVMLLLPTQQFGSGLDRSKTTVKDVQAKMIFDSNTGTYWIEPNIPLEPLDVVIEEADIRVVKLIGNKLHVSTKCKGLDELNSLIESLYFGLPILLNVEFVDPPVVERVEGKIGDVSFRWELQKWDASFDITTKELQETRFVDTWQRLGTISLSENRRILAGLHYFHLACRLANVGHSPWEFMGEVILNLNKVLEAMFNGPEGETIDTVRIQLGSLGISEQDIEKHFIPIIALRNNIDSGHVLLSVFNQPQLEILHTFLENAISSFRGLLKIVLEKARKGEQIVKPYSNLKPRKSAVEIIRRIEQHLSEAQAQNKPHVFDYHDYLKSNIAGR